MQQTTPTVMDCARAAIVEMWAKTAVDMSCFRTNTTVSMLAIFVDVFASTSAKIFAHLTMKMMWILTHCALMSILVLSTLTTMWMET